MPDGTDVSDLADLVGPPDDDQTIVGLSPREQLLVWVGFPVLGALAGWLVKLAASAVQELGWIPLPGRFRFVAELASHEPYATVGSVVLGVGVGVVVAMFTIGEDLRVTIDAEHLCLRRDEDERQLDRTDISALFVEDKTLVILGLRGEELAREPCDHGKQLAEALIGHGYPWRADDPFADGYRRWVPDLPGLPEGADALLRARARAIEEDDTDDACQLRQELADLGVVVRDDGGKQFWRLVDPA